MNKALWWLTVPIFLCSQYSVDTMQAVAEYREANGLRLRDTDGYVAVVDHEFLGDILWLKQLGSDKCESFQVVDWSSPYMKRADGMTGGEWMRSYNIGIEISHETATEWEVVGEMAYAMACDEIDVMR